MGRGRGARAHFGPSRAPAVAAAALVVLALMVAMAAPASAVTGTPVVTTGAATAVASTTATVTGTVNPQGHQSTWDVEYGTSAAYGSSTSVEPIPSGVSQPIDEVAGLSGLAPGTTYHYRFVATNIHGTGAGDDATFTTGAAPGVTTGGASSVSSTSAVVSGVVNPSGSATTWRFVFGRTSSYGGSSPSGGLPAGRGAIPVSTTLSGLSPATTYHYRLLATNSDGTTTGADATFRTEATSPIGRPPVVTTGTATSTTGTQTTVVGTVNPTGSVTTVSAQYGTTPAYGASSPAQVLGPANSAEPVTLTLSGLTPHTTYHYRIVATNAYGSAVGSDQSVQTAPKASPTSASTSSTPSAATTTSASTTSTSVSAGSDSPANPFGLSSTVIAANVPVPPHGARTGGTAFWIAVGLALVILLLVGGVGGYFVVSHGRHED